MESIKEAVGRVLQGVAESPVNVNYDLCVRSRFVRSECSECINVCPKEAIALESGRIQVMQNCDSCGACIPACPNGALEIPALVPTLKKIEEIHDDSIVFVCRKYPSQSQPANFIRVNCISGLNIHEILYANHKSNNITIVIGDCASCESKKGMRNFKNTIMAVRKLSPGKGNIRIINHSVKIKPIDLERRALFAHLANKVLRIKKENHIKIRENRQGKNHHRSALMELLSAYKNELSGNLPETYPAGEINIDINKCFGCNVCEHVCPGGAITRIEDGETVSIMFNPSWCSACNACASACLTGAITLTKGLSIAKFIDNKDVKLVELKLTICRECGMDFYSYSSELCPRCVKVAKQEVRL